MCSTQISYIKYLLGLVHQACLCSFPLVQTVCFYCIGDVQYSDKLHKVFVRFDASCPFLFSSCRATPSGCVVRAMPVFVRPQHVREVVRRCPHHARKPTAIGPGAAGPPSDHLIRCEHKLASYHEDTNTGFHSVVVPYDVPTGVFCITLVCFARSCSIFSN